MLSPSITPSTGARNVIVSSTGRSNSVIFSHSFFQDIPIVVAGNKIDLVREVDRDEVIDWVTSEMSKQRYEHPVNVVCKKEVVM